MSVEAEQVAEALRLYVTEATGLRYGVFSPGPEADADDVLASMLVVRQRLDRIEELYLKAIQVRSAVVRKSSASKAIAEEAWAAEISNARKSSVRRGDEFTGPRERYADADLATLELKRAARRDADLLTTAQDSAEALRTMLRGLDGLRQDHQTWLRTLNFQTVLN